MAVGVIGVGQIPCVKRLRGKDLREMLYEAAKKAYREAELTPDDVDAVVACGLEFFEGVSITDSYTPDQVGGRLKFNTLIGNDSLTAFIHACMLIETGFYDVVLVEAHSKPSDILNYEHALLNSLDPHYLRPLGLHPYVIAGLDASSYLSLSGADTRDLSLISVKNLKNGVCNSYAVKSSSLTVEEIEETETVFHPIKQGHMAVRCDYAAVVILASKVVAKRHPNPIWIRGFGYSSCASSSSPDQKKWGEANWARLAAKTSFDNTSLKPKEVDLVEVSEPISYLELQILDSLGVLNGPAHKYLRLGEFDIGGSLPTNPSGGCIGMGYPLTAAGLQRLIECVTQLRGEAAGRQVQYARTALAASPDSEISDAGAVVLLGVEAE